MADKELERPPSEGIGEIPIPGDRLIGEGPSNRGQHEEYHHEQGAFHGSPYPTSPAELLLGAGV